jgi:hypothetical protein
MIPHDRRAGNGVMERVGDSKGYSSPPPIHQGAGETPILRQGYPGLFNSSKSLFVQANYKFNLKTSAHRHQFFGAGGMNSHGIVKIAPGGAHAHHFGQAYPADGGMAEHYKNPPLMGGIVKHQSGFTAQFKRAAFPAAA